jgi:hypothetical protein
MEVEGGLKKVDDFDATMSNSEPNLALAWAYFEHVSLYRYLVPKDEAKQNKRCCHKLRDRKLDKAEPGENDDPLLILNLETLALALDCTSLLFELSRSSLSWRAWCLSTISCTLHLMHNSHLKTA